MGLIKAGLKAAVAITQTEFEQLQARALAG